MIMKTIDTIKDFLYGQTHGEIRCLYKKVPVRWLTLDGDGVIIQAADGANVRVSVTEPVLYEPWFGDRGSLLVNSEFGLIKLCTEGDVFHFPDGVNTACIVPA